MIPIGLSESIRQLRCDSSNPSRDIEPHETTQSALDGQERAPYQPRAALRVTCLCAEVAIVLDTDYGQDYVEECRRFLKAVKVVVGS